jgi:hypothetical protein
MVTQNHFNDKSGASETNFDSDAIHVNLHGPITSIDAVANNTPRADGKGELEHLLGRPISIILTEKQLKNILDEIKEKEEAAGIREINNENYRKSASIVYDTFKKHLPEQTQIIIEGNKKFYTPIKEYDLEKFNERVKEQTSVNMLRILAGGAAANKLFGGVLVLVRDVDSTPRETAASYMGFDSPDDIPDNVPGDKNTWIAATDLHELEHLIGQKFEKDENAPENIKDYVATLKEIDAENAMRVLMRPHVTEEFLEYRNNARIIGTIQNLTRSSDKDVWLDGTKNSLQHAMGHPLEHLQDIRKGQYSIANHLKEADTLSIKIREHLGFTDSSLDVTKDQCSFREITTAVKELIEKDNLARQVMSSGNNVEPILTDNERSIAAQFIQAVDDVGFNKMWAAQQRLEQQSNIEQPEPSTLTTSNIP